MTLEEALRRAHAIIAEMRRQSRMDVLDWQKREYEKKAVAIETLIDLCEKIKPSPSCSNPPKAVVCEKSFREV